MSIWLTARGAGLAALLLLTAATCLGAWASAPGHEPGRRFVLQYTHRAVAALGLGALALHVLTILADSYANVGVAGAVVPFTSGYRATAVGLGTIAAYLLVLVAAVGFARGRIAASPSGARSWRAVHASSYAAWVLAMLHGLLSGTDSPLGWVTALYIGCFAAVAGFLAVRLTQSAARPTAVPAKVAAR